MSKFKFETRNEYGQWVDDECGVQDPSNYLDTREAAEAQVPALARHLMCEPADIRVVQA